MIENGDRKTDTFNNTYQWKNKPYEFLAADKEFPRRRFAPWHCIGKRRRKIVLHDENKKKSTLVAATLVLVLAFSLTGCAAENGLNDETNLPTTDNQEEQQNESDVQTNYLRVLNTQDQYENGKMFADVPGDFAGSFQNKAAALTVPDARKSEKTVDIRESSESRRNSTILFLNSIPDQNIYLYGYNDMDYPGYGLILDVGEEQQVYAFPYRYMTNTTLAPDLYAGGDGRVMYISCHTMNGTGVSVSELYVFQVSGNEIESYYVDINDLADCLSNKVAMSYDAESKRVTVYAGGEQIMTDSPTSFIGAFDGENIAPDSFYCGDQISYIINGDSVRVSFVPTLYSQAQPGARSYLESLISLEADIVFEYDGDGIISNFSIGKIVPVM